LSIGGKNWTPLSHALAQGRAGMVPLLLAHAKKKKADAAGGEAVGSMYMPVCMPGCVLSRRSMHT
jgi:hypothetical protein